MLSKYYSKAFMFTHRKIIIPQKYANKFLGNISFSFHSLLVARTYKNLQTPIHALIENRNNSKITDNTRHESVSSGKI